MEYCARVVGALALSMVSITPGVSSLMSTFNRRQARPTGPERVSQGENNRMRVRFTRMGMDRVGSHRHRPFNI